MKKLYVGNLPFSATEDTLHEFFTQSGVNPSAVNLIRDRFTGQSRGFAFVEISNDEEAERAVNSLNGQNFGGRNLVVNEARPMREGGRGESRTRSLGPDVPRLARVRDNPAGGTIGDRPNRVVRTRSHRVVSRNGAAVVTQLQHNMRHLGD